MAKWEVSDELDARVRERTDDVRLYIEQLVSNHLNFEDEDDPAFQAELIARTKQQGIVDLFGEVEYEEGHDNKTHRKRGDEQT